MKLQTYFFLKKDRPKRGDIAICRYPRGGGQLWARRAVLVLDSTEEGSFHRVRIAFGTTLASGSSSRFLVGIVDPAKVDAARLKYATWFDLRRVVSVPYTAKLFDVNYRGTAIIGQLDIDELTHVEAILGQNVIDAERFEAPPKISTAGMAFATLRALAQRSYPTV